MSDNHGRFVWYELMTTDMGAAQAFYTNVVGWGARDAEMPGMTYILFTAGETPVSGLMDLPESARNMGAPPSWIGYVAVDDVDAAADKAKRLGGTVYVPPTDIPDVGRFSVIADPQAAAIVLFTASNPPQGQFQQGAPGSIGWHELFAADWEKAFAFYSQLFGWQKADAMDMGPMGTYQLFSAGGQLIGGMFTKPPAVPVPFWLYYVVVDDIDAAIERVKVGGGQILNGPMQVPGGDWIIQGRDPQGAMFALVGKRS
jgi:predicted enzyme related to lactoylglutathione lyase